MATQRQRGRILGVRPPQRIRLQRLDVRDFKALDHLVLEFPPPDLATDPDVFVLGSRNGVGKTSVLEACSLLFVAASVGTSDLFGDRSFFYRMQMPIDLVDIVVRASAKKAVVQGAFLVNKDEQKIELSISRAEGFIVEPADGFKTRVAEDLVRSVGPSEPLARAVFALAGLNSEPLVFPQFLYFHSYRKVQEGNPEIGMVAEGAPRRRRPGFAAGDYPISTFKLELLRSMMSQKGLFEAIEDPRGDAVFDTVNKLVERFAGGRIEKLRPLQDNTMEFRVTPTGGGKPFSFDGLSSGQKEVISTLFLIWLYTLEKPGIVLIDEPELHLNPEWHRTFVRSLFEIAPRNQYIVATHSEEIFASVLPERRLMLTGASRVNS